MSDERTSGEIARTLDAILAQLGAMNSKFDSLSQTYVLRESYELMVGGIKVDQSRIERKADDAKTGVEQLDDKLDSRFRSLVAGLLIAVVAPTVVGVVLYLLIGSTQ